ncbi:MAG: adenosine deaminase [Actinomycetia bacterium]|nr:adenosine deaminase [Actinomycetes bacterium]
MGDDVRSDLSDEEFVAGIPKVELHVHLEGTIEPLSLFRIAERNGIELPYDSPEGVVAFQAERRAPGNESLVNFLECLDISRGALRTGADYHTITVDFLARCRDEGVRYVEMMVDPQQAIRQGVPLGDCVEAITQGRADGLTNHGVRSQLIMCFQRDHPAAEAEALLEQADAHRDSIVGIGLDNYETPGFPALFAATYELARRREYRLTSHCDVNQPDSIRHIRACIEDLGVERIDHGLNTATDPSLVDLVLERGIALTACPTFYHGQQGAAESRLDMYRSLLDAGTMISLNTDDPAQFGSGWLTNTISEAMAAARFSRSDLVRFMHNAIDSAWTDEHHRRDLTSELLTFCNR